MQKHYYPHIIALIWGVVTFPFITLGIDLIFATQSVLGVIFMYGPIIVNVVLVVLLIFLPVFKPFEETLAKHIRLALITLAVGYAIGFFAITITQSLIN